MTRRTKKSTLDPTYSRQGSEDTCTHAPEAHVVYDLLGSGYRAELRCRCHQVRMTSQRIRDTHAAATRDADAWLLRRRT
jgi:hypothetical protein